MLRTATFTLVFLALLLGPSCAPVKNKDGPPKDVVVEDKKNPIEVPKELQQRVKATLEHVHGRELETTYSFWTVFHAILGMGFDTPLLDRKAGKRYNAVEYICEGKDLPGIHFIPTPHGVDVKIGPVGSGQGHQDQFIAEMAQWGMPADKKFKIGGKEYRFLDFVHYSKMHASATKSQELGWAVLVIPQYYGIDVAPWTNKHGEKVSLEELIRAELKIEMPKAACGGTHSLFGLTWAYQMHLSKGGKTEGVWTEVKSHLEKYRRMAKENVNADGSFCNEYMNDTGIIKDPDRRINTTGHVLEWLALYLSDDELREEWVQDIVMSLCKMVLDRAHNAIDTGSLYHATHGLHIYYDRVFGPLEGKQRPLMPLQGKGKV